MKKVKKIIIIPAQSPVNKQKALFFEAEYPEKGDQSTETEKMSCSYVNFMSSLPLNVYIFLERERESAIYPTCSLWLCEREQSSVLIKLWLMNQMQEGTIRALCGPLFFSLSYI